LAAAGARPDVRAPVPGVPHALSPHAGDLRPPAPRRRRSEIHAMTLIDKVRDRLRQPTERALSAAFRHAKRVPFVRRRLEAEYERMLEEIRKAAKPYRDRVPSHVRLPEQGQDRVALLGQI